MIVCLPALCIYIFSYFFREKTHLTEAIKQHLRLFIDLWLSVLDVCYDMLGNPTARYEMLHLGNGKSTFILHISALMVASWRAPC